MAKDPAFMFYSNDYYSGTRTMLPEERACYVDLLVYQHQNGPIPADDLDRLLMFCSGVGKATLKATLEAKFELRSTESGGVYVNKKLEKLTFERKEYKESQSMNGTIGVFWKNAKRKLSASKYRELYNFAQENFSKNELFEYLKTHKNKEASLQGLLKRCLSIIEDENESEDEDENKSKDKSKNIIKGESKKFKKPSIDEIYSYLSLLDYSGDKESTSKAFFNYYESNGWKVGRGNPMKDWKASLRGWISREKDFKPKVSQAVNDREKRQKLYKEMGL